MSAGGTPSNSSNLVCWQNGAGRESSPPGGEDKKNRRTVGWRGRRKGSVKEAGRSQTQEEEGGRDGGVAGRPLQAPRDGRRRGQGSSPP